MVKNSPSSAGWGAGSIPDRGAKIPHASGPKKQNINQKQYCNKFKKTLKMVHIKKEKKNNNRYTHLRSSFEFRLEVLRI